MKIKTSELTGPALDWAVGQATEAWTWMHKYHPTMTLDPTFRGMTEEAVGGVVYLLPNNPMRQDPQPFNPSSDWAIGGLLVCEYNIDLCCEWEGMHCATMNTKDGNTMVPDWYEYDADGFVYGATKLEAACRCIVAHKIGYEVDIPDGLVKSDG